MTLSTLPYWTAGHPDSTAVVDEIARLARTASVEVNVQDEMLLDKTHRLLALGTKMYVSHLPGQAWEATRSMCLAVRRAGYEPIAHLPVRVVGSAGMLENILQGLAQSSRPRDILLIAGDYAVPAGPYSEVSQVLETGMLERHGFAEVSLAGHPEGHPRLAEDVIRAAERRKAALAGDHGLGATLVTQFLFEPEPFIDWASGLKSLGVVSKTVCGLAGPAKITTLLRYAARCGVGASIRALGARPKSIANLLGDHGPDEMMRSLAEASLMQRCELAGVHFFCFGGLMRTVEWLVRVGRGEFVLNDQGGFIA